MGTFIEEHLNRDKIDNIGEIYSQRLDNTNPNIDNVGIKIEKNRVLTLNPGKGSTFPIIGELIERNPNSTDYASMLVYSIDDFIRTDKNVYEVGYDLDYLNIKSSDYLNATKEIKDYSYFRYITMKRMKTRQMITLDVISHNSQAMVMFGSSKIVSAPLSVNTDTYSLGSIDRQLSTFNINKLAREITAVMFDSKGDLCLAINRNEIQDNFNGLIEYEVLDTSESIERVIENKKIIVTEKSEDIDYIPLTEALFISSVISDDKEKGNIAEILQNLSETVINIDKDELLPGELFIMNKTHNNIRVLLNNGTTVSLDPYGIKKIDESLIEVITLFKNTYSRPSNVSCNIDGMLYKKRGFFKATFVGGYYSESSSKYVIYDIDKDGIKYIENSVPGSLVSVGPYCTGIKISEDDIKSKNIISKFGDGENAFYGITVDNTDIYIDGSDLYAKRSSDINFTKVSLENKDNGDTYSAKVGDVTFYTKNKISAGSVHRNENFSYESNYIVSNSAVTAEVIGNIYPIDFFRVTRKFLKLCTSVSEYPMEDGLINSKNSYEAAEVSLVYSREDGHITVGNRKNPSDNIINYSYTKVFGKSSNSPVVVESFGYVSRGTLLGTIEEHFVSKMIRDLDKSGNKKKYAGKIEKITSKYRFMWVKLRKVGTNSSVLLMENEYDDEHACHLGESSYLENKTKCKDRNFVEQSKLEWESNMFTYPIYYSYSNNSVAIREILFKEMRINKGVSSNHAGTLASSNIDSIDRINDIAVTAFSAQTETSVLDTSVFSKPTVIETDNTVQTRKTVVSIPEIGFFYYTKEKIVFSDIDKYSESEIIDTFKRGILFKWDDYSLEAYLEYRQSSTNVFSVYNFMDIDGKIITTIEQKFPDSAVSTDIEYSVDELYKVYRPVKNSDSGTLFPSQKCIPMYLANKLHKKYGHIQNIIGVWDESSGVLIKDSDLKFIEEKMESGFKIEPLCSNVSPIDISDEYAMISVYKTGKPYDVSDDVRVSIKRSGYINGLDEKRSGLSDIAYEGGNNDLASRFTISSIVSNMSSDSSRVQISPKTFGMQGPWKNTVDYTEAIEKVLMSGDLKFGIKPNSRIILDFVVAANNILSLNYNGRLFDKMYDIIDGYVEQEIVIDDIETPIQRGNTTYLLNYINHSGGDTLLKRSIFVDLEVYPARLSYPKNNVIRELISPVREDGFSKKMDARAVYVRFDTQYIKKSIHSYYDKFIEIPTALTCDSLPEESVLSRSHSNSDSLYSDKTSKVIGDEIVSSNGSIKLSFDNPTNKNIILIPLFNNSRMSYEKHNSNISSIKVDEVYKLMSSGFLFAGKDEEISLDRTKSGIFYIET